MSKDFNERRKYVRIKSRNVIKCKKYSSQTVVDEIKSTMSKNISAGGILIESKKNTMSTMF